MANLVPAELCGSTWMQGMHPRRDLPVILGSPHHHIALMQLGAHAAAMRDAVAAVGDPEGVLISVVRVARRPPP